MDKIRWARAFALMLLGAAGFWLPDVFLHAVRAHNFNSRDVRIITVVTPLTLLGTFVAAKWANKGARTRRIGLLMITGVWLFAGLFMTVGASFSGGGFMGPDGARGAVLAMSLSLFPMYTFIMATYDGSLGALLLVTAAALFVWILQRSKLLARFRTNPAP
jgi:hypothetical protein